MGGDTGSGAGGAGSGSGSGTGTSICWIKKYDKNGNLIGGDTYGYFFSGGCPSVSTQANNYCVEQIITSGTGVYRCTYDCGC